MTDDHPFVRRSARAAGIQQMVCIAFAGLVLVCIHGCPETSQPHPAASANLSPQQQNQCVVACSKLALYGCIEGMDSHCIGVCEHTIDAGLAPLDVECIVSADSKSAERACAGIKCP